MTARELRPVGRYEWEQIVRRARLGGVIQGSARVGKNGRPTKGGMSATLLKAIALGFATYANDKGREIWPGDATVAVDLETSVASVEAVRKLLLRLGLFERVRAPWGDHGTEYRLTLPVDLLDEVEVLTPAQHKLAANRLRDARRGKPSGGSDGSTVTSDSVDPSEPPEAVDEPVDNPEPVDPPDTPEDDWPPVAGVSTGTTPAPNGVSGGPRMVYPPDAHTDHDRPPTTTDHPVEDLRTAVTATREAPPEQDPIPVGCGQCAKGYVKTADSIERCPTCPPPEPPAGLPSNVIRFPSERVA